MPLPACSWQDAEQPDAADSEAKKDLLKRMDTLETKLPPDLARKLIVISMKIATGWCSPHLTKEFAADIDKLTDEERKPFEKEWKAVREHRAWPCVIAAKQRKP